METENKSLSILFASFFGCIAVIAGAFGAHLLEPVLTQNSKTSVYELAVRYQFFHSIVLFIIGVLRTQQNYYINQSLKWATAWFVAGIICFSGSLYLLSFFSIGKFALLTPLGGVFLIAGWLCVMYFSWTVYKKGSKV